MSKTKVNDSLCNLTFDEYLNFVKKNHPKLFAMLDIEGLTSNDVEARIAEMNAASWEFEDEEVGGRGAAYNSAQQSFENRQIGMTKLLSLFSDNIKPSSNHNKYVLDV